jgi:hypothetical protein
MPWISFSSAAMAPRGKQAAAAVDPPITSTERRVSPRAALTA